MPIGNKYNSDGSLVTQEQVDAAKKRYDKPKGATQYYVDENGCIRRRTPKVYYTKAQRRAVIKLRRQQKAECA